VVEYIAMGAKRGYDIFPRTPLARAGLALAFFGGLVATVGYFVIFFGVGFGGPLAPWDVFEKREITFENRTAYYVRVYVDGEFEVALEPNETETIRDLKFLWWTARPVEAVDASGRVLYSANLDDDDLEDLDYRIVIEDAGEESEGDEGAPAARETPRHTPSPGEDDLTSDVGDLEEAYPPCTFDLEECLEPQAELEDVSSHLCRDSGPRVCFVPMGQVDPQLVMYLVDYFRDEYGLDVGVMTPSAIPEELIDPDRQQVEGSGLALRGAALFERDFRDSKVTFISLTPVDLYLKERTWNWAFGTYATTGQKFGVVSTYRMHLGAFGLVDDEKAYERTRKMVTRYIGLLHYELEPTADPESLMYNNILSIGDLDRMGGVLPVEDAR
jgi:predicted Zn-dependent protease